MRGHGAFLCVARFHSNANIFGGLVIAFTRRVILTAGAAAAGAYVSRRISSNGPTLDGVEMIIPEGGGNTLNDASRLSQTPIHKHVIVREKPGDALLSALRTELRAATSANRPVNVAAARHSMGGQSIPRGGHAITFEIPWVEPGDGIYRVHAGARWRDVIAALHPVGLAPKVMQANNDFGIGATFSVNAHGWATPHGPMGSTVRSLKILLADGSHISASATENSDIFAAAMGGYGLFGIITELEVEAAQSELYEPTFQSMHADNFSEAFQNAVLQVPMAYGRLNVDRSGFFSDALLLTYRPSVGEISDLSPPSVALTSLKRQIFRSQTTNEWAKRRRWGVETGLGPLISGPISRSALMNESVNALLRQSDPNRTDIIHEYFVTPERFNEFLVACREIIPGSYQELLNVTLRWVEQDSASVLSYAPRGSRIASVMSFSQEMTARAEADMASMTRRLIDAVLALGGSYYLPYRPHATVEQFVKGYPRATEFVKLKRDLDSGLLFRNALWDNYLSDM